jgi:hypothetical protein
MQIGTRRFGVVLGVLFAVGLVLALAADASPVISLAVGAVYAAALGGLLALLTYLKARNGNAKRIPAGTVVEGEVSDEALTFRHRSATRRSRTRGSPRCGPSAGGCSCARSAAP